MRRGETMTRITRRSPTSTAMTGPSPGGWTRRVMAILALVLPFILAASDARALTQTQSVAGTCVDDSGIGTVAWVNPGNATTSDNVYATATPGGPNKASHFLKCTGFGFSIPSNATIQGIQVE